MVGDKVTTCRWRGGFGRARNATAYDYLPYERKDPGDDPVTSTSTHLPVTNPESPFLAIDRDGWLYGLGSEADVIGELEDTDVNGGEYEIYDRHARRVLVVFHDRTADFTLESAQPQGQRVRDAVDSFFTQHAIAMPTVDDAGLVPVAVQALREWAR